MGGASWSPISAHLRSRRWWRGASRWYRTGDRDPAGLGDSLTVPNQRSGRGRHLLRYPPRDTVAGSVIPPPPPQRSRADPSPRPCRHIWASGEWLRGSLAPRWAVPESCSDHLPNDWSTVPEWVWGGEVMYWPMSLSTDITVSDAAVNAASLS